MLVRVIKRKDFSVFEKIKKIGNEKNVEFL